jgi:hypothetical protein
MSDEQPTQHVVVRDVQMRFGSMVVFMVKWAIASIPALIILVVLTVVTIGVTTGMVGSLSRGRSAISATGTGSTEPSSKTVDPAVAAYLDKVLVRGVKVGLSALDEQAVWGEIKNTGDRTLKEVDIVVYCLGADGKPVFEKTYYPVMVSEGPSFGRDNEPLKPGYSRPFGVKLDDAPSEWSKKVEVKVTAVEFQ